STILLFKKTGLFYSIFVSVFEATYFVASFIGFFPPSACGQYDANISNVFLPNNRSKGLLICSAIVLPRKSSKYGTVHPPYVKLTFVSSLYPLGPCMTPSRFM